MNKNIFNKVTIVGVGVLGGSIGMSLRKKRLAGKVVGYFRNKNKIATAVKLGAVDSGCDSFEDAVKNSDLVILCTPVNDIMPKLKKNRNLLKSIPLITDIGSTKFEIVKSARGLNFIGSHPLAGSEQSGIKGAKKDMFLNSLCILTPESARDKQKLLKIKLFWQKLGARTIIMKPKEHDRILAFTSHLPHILAYTLIKTIPNGMLEFSAGGLNDTTRIALSNPAIWAGIFCTNGKEITKALENMEKALKQFKRLISKRDLKKLNAIMADAQNKRKRLTAKP